MAQMNPQPEQLINHHGPTIANLNLSEFADIVYGAAAARHAPSPLPLPVDVDELSVLWFLDHPVADSATAAAAAPAVRNDSVVVVRAPATCRLYQFMGELALRLGYHGGASQMMDWKSYEVLRLGPESTDVEVLHAMRHGSYAVSCALFWMQNRECLSHIHVMSDIILSREWSARFFDVLSSVIVDPIVSQEAVPAPLRKPAQMQSIPVYERDIKRRQESALQLRARLAQPPPRVGVDIDDIVKVVPFALPRRPLSPVAPEKRHATLMLAMFRDAARNQDLTFDHMAITVSRFCRNVLHRTTEAEIRATQDRLESRHHSIVKFAELLAMDFAGRAPSKAAEKLWAHERAKLTVWICNFLDHGCACTS